MSQSKTSTANDRWYAIPVRVLVVTFLLTLLSFAISLLIGILWLVVAGVSKGLHPNMTTAYRQIALPATAVAGTLILVSTAVMEIRRHHQAKTLAEIERTMKGRVS